MNEKYKKIIKTILEWLIYAVIFIVIVWGTPKVLVKILKSEYPIASITSSSMWPALKQGDIVFIKGLADKRDIQIGDIVVYVNDPEKSNGREGFTIHRVTELKEETLVTKGDANNISDPPIKYDQLIGKMITINNKPFRIPYLGKLSQIVKK